MGPGPSTTYWGAGTAAVGGGRAKRDINNRGAAGEDLDGESAMNRCRRLTLIVFGGLFLAALLIVPYRSERVVLVRDPQTNTVWQRTARDGGYMSLSRFLKRSKALQTVASDRDVRYALRRKEEIASVRYELNTGLLAVELGAIIILAVYDLIFVCRRRRRTGGAVEEALPGGPP